MEDLEDTFAMDAAGGSAGGSGISVSPKSPVKNQSITTLLDITRANNVGQYSSLRLLDMLVISDSWTGYTSDHVVEDQAGATRHQEGVT